jgi:heme/copper-type cytochrome/quinol oxidase subunit 2
VTRGIDDAFLVAAAIVFVIGAGLVGWGIFRYRQEDLQGTPSSRPAASVRLELVWWAVPTILALVLFILTAQVLSSGQTRNGAPIVQGTPGTSQTP